MTNTTRKYCFIQFLFKYTTNATKKWVGSAQKHYSYCGKPSSTRMAHRVTINKPNTPMNRKKRASNTLRKRSAYLLVLNESSVIILNNMDKNKQRRKQSYRWRVGRNRAATLFSFALPTCGHRPLHYRALSSGNRAGTSTVRW